MFLNNSIMRIHVCRHQYCLRRNQSIPWYSHKRHFKTSIKNIVKSNVTKENLIDNPPATYKNLFKPTAFALMFSSASFAGATIWQYENMRKRAQLLISSPKKWIMDKLELPSVGIQDKVGETFERKSGVTRQLVNTWWNSKSDGEKLFVLIAFLNTLVFLAWKVPFWRGSMTRFFCSHPSSASVCWSMFLSTFSHCRALHLVVNMFVLNSFITSVVSTLGKEQFVAFYCSAGVFSSLLSNICKVVTSQSTVSLGASGAIMAVLGYTCSKYPDTLLTIVFLPFIVFKASVGIKALMGIDALGVFFGWKILDHAAHLGGALFGLWWCSWGNALIWQNRGPVLECWHKMRASLR